jgi:O-methyltransferase involved in polyketide biosynthesis
LASPEARNLARPWAQQAASALLRARPGLRDLPAVREHAFLGILERTINPPASVVEVGAGFSALGLRLAYGHPEIRYVETDLSSVVAEKQVRVQRLGQPVGWTALPFDLARDPWPLGEAADAIVAQGVLVYERPARLVEILARWRRQLAPGGVVVFDLLLRQPPSRLGATWTRLRGLGATNGPFHGTLRSLGDAAALIAEAGFASSDVRGLDAWATGLGLPPAGVPDEVVCVARM